MNTKVSVIIPAANEIMLNKTVDDLFAKAGGPVEIIAVLDGAWPHDRLWPKPNDNLIYIHHGRQKGMKAAINAGIRVASGKYVMKCDAHCMFCENWDMILKADCDDDWVVIPSRYSLSRDKWEIMDTGKSRIDYHLLDFPSQPGAGIHGKVWTQRARERKDKPEYMIDDEMSFQGSCWFTHLELVRDRMGGFSEVGYGTFKQEPQQLGLWVWMTGGRNKVNKNAWYAHLHKGTAVRENDGVTQQGRGYFMNKHEGDMGNDYSAWFWLTDQPFEGRVRKMQDLLDIFWPVPGWSENWADLVYERIAI